MTKGIFLTSFGNAAYAYMAYNLAMTVKYYDNDIPITIATDGNIGWLTEQEKNTFDTVVAIPESFKNKDGSFDPGKVKVMSYDLLPYDYTLYLDVDAIAMRSLKPVFDGLINDGGYYYTHLYGLNRHGDAEKLEFNQWADKSIVWDHFKLDSKSVFPGCNTSIQFIKKCKESKEFLKKVQDNYFNPVSLSKLRFQWGGGQPDELYVSGTMAQFDITGQMPKAYMFFGNEIDKLGIDRVHEEHELLSVYGGKGFTKTIYTELYDNILTSLHINKQGEHKYKYNSFIVQHKHANNKPTQDSAGSGDSVISKNIDITQPKVLLPLMQPIYSNKSQRVELVQGQIHINDTTLIDASLLIQRYPAPLRGEVRVSNWLNCSFIEFKGKKIFCYRMEAQPFCTVMKLGICLLDDNLQPIKDSNVLLNLHSSLRGFEEGFHVEDPRLFIFNDELYLSYTDGYQMAQAKIDIDTLQATESFYIDKPNEGTTEKNWTFFEYDKKLYCIYDLNTMTVFEMNGSKWKEVSKSEWNGCWSFGVLRGGTSPVRVGNNFLTFFHSALDIRNRPGRQYFMGALMFEAKPPFTPIAISKIPLIAGEHIAEGIPRLSNKIFAVFPCGQIRKEKSWAVSFGYNDLQCRYVDISDELLSKSFVKTRVANEVI